MKLHLVIAAATLGIVATGCSGASVGGALSGGKEGAAAWSASLTETRGSVLKIDSVSCDFEGSGSGFVYDKHTLITNKHVVAGARSLSVETQSGRVFNVTVADASEVEDIAVVHTVESLPTPLRLADKDPIPGDLVRALGYPLGGSFKATEGRVIDFINGTDYGHQSQLIRSSAEIRPGNSGGPLVGADGRVEGINFAIQLNSGDTLAIPVSRLRQVLADSSSDFKTVSTSCE